VNPCPKRADKEYEYFEDMLEDSNYEEGVD
jgi:hypothetical protein